MRNTPAATVIRSGLVEACDDPQLFGVTLTPRQRDLLAAVEQGDLLHVWALGRRSGKTLLGAIVGLWMCLLRPDMAEYVRRRERRYMVDVAVNLRQSRISVEQARSIVEASPLLAGLLESATEDELRFSNRSAFAAFPCTSRGGRGWPVMCLLMDEAAHQLDGEGNQAAEPVFRALYPSVSQFGGDARVIVASSPYGTDGFFADLYHSVEKGELPGAVCAQASTLAMRPGFATQALELERLRDPEGFRAEYGAEFVAAGGAYLDWTHVGAAIARRGELAPGSVDDPVAAIDLAFARDTSALVIVGRDRKDPERLRLVLARHWAPGPGGLQFTPLLDEIGALCLEHGVTRIYTDQFSAAPTLEHLRRHGLHAQQVPTSAQTKTEMFGAVKSRLYAGQLELFPHERLEAELARIESVTTPGQSGVRIRRVGDSHGDVVTALALAVSKLRGFGRGGTSTSPNTMRVHRLDGRVPVPTPGGWDKVPPEFGSQRDLRNFPLMGGR